MQYYRCRCGYKTAWTTMGVYRCERCPKCGSNLAQSPDSHSEPEPHVYITQYNVDTGEPYELCRTCYITRAELEKSFEPEPAKPIPTAYELFFKSLNLQVIPHCDSLVLHRPENCEYCSDPKYAPLHEFRKREGINYTGENDPSKAPCPAELKRSAETINRWHGNRATKSGEQ